MPTKIKSRIDPNATNEYQRGIVITPNNRVKKKLAIMIGFTKGGVSSSRRFSYIHT